MAHVLAGIAVVGCLLGLMGAFGALAIRARRRGATASALGAAMAAYDEAMHTTAYATFVEMRSQDERTSPAAAPEQ
jgi:hypothetical protein